MTKMVDTSAIESELDQKRSLEDRVKRMVEEELERRDTTWEPKEESASDKHFEKLMSDPSVAFVNPSLVRAFCDHKFNSNKEKPKETNAKTKEKLIAQTVLKHGASIVMCLEQVLGCRFNEAMIKLVLDEVYAALEDYEKERKRSW